MDINWSADSGDGVCIEGGDPKDTNRTIQNNILQEIQFIQAQQGPKS